MKAMLMTSVCNIDDNHNPLVLSDIPIPSPKSNEILIKVSACGVCHTEIDEIEGRTPPPQLPVVLGHQVVGKVTEKGKNVHRFNIGDKVGVGWIYSSCGKCEYCMRGYDNLCPDFKATGRDANGGYAEYMIVPAKSSFKIPENHNDSEAAPLLCAGAIGYRSLKLANIKNGNTLGLTGFGASAHLVLKLVKFLHPWTRIYVFARSEKEREFAIQLGAEWAGKPEDFSPELCNSIIDTTPVWYTIVEAMKNLKPGGRLVINAIRKEDTDKEYLNKLNYEDHLWHEKEIKSVANVSVNDIKEFLEIAAKYNIKPEYQEFTLKEANKALLELKQRKIKGAKVIRLL